MKLKSLIALFAASLLSAGVFANECQETCEQEYKDCKAVAESATAKQACEDDAAACKAECK